MRFIFALFLGVLFGWFGNAYFQSNSPKQPPAPIITAKKPVFIEAKKAQITNKLSLPETIILAFNQGDFIKANSLLTDLLKIAPYQPQTLMLAADIYLKKQAYLPALNALESILNQVQTDYSVAEVEQKFLYISQRYLAQLANNNALKKRDFLSRIINILPEHLEFRYQLGNLLLSLEYFDEAEQQLYYLADNQQWKQQFNTLNNALNYARIFQQGDVKIPLIYRAGNWYVNAFINAKAAVLLLDTGANLTTLSVHLVANQDLSRSKTIKIHTANGITTAHSINIKKFTIDPISKYNFPVAILPKTKLPPNIDGLLGTNWLRDFHFIIDKKQSLLWLTK